MARTIPYIFCRYQMAVEDEQLDGDGQKALFDEVQGTPVPHGVAKDGQVARNAMVMSPRAGETGDVAFLSFLIGLQPGVRWRTGYDREKRALTRNWERDTHIKYAHALAIPAIGCIAIEDRSGDDRVTARTAISVLRSIVASAAEGTGHLDVIHISDAEVRKIVGSWQLTEYLYTVRPLNPVTLSDMANMRSDAMKRERVAQETGKLVPQPGKTMEANGGTISTTQEIVDVGYGQNGFRAVTPGGQTVDRRGKGTPVAG